MPNQQPQPAAATQPEEIAGLVERVTFHNDETGFCVLRIKARGYRELVTMVGTLPEVRAGEWLRLSIGHRTNPQMLTLRECSLGSECAGQVPVTIKFTRP
jgi:hypothetical protein